MIQILIKLGTFDDKILAPRAAEFGKKTIYKKTSSLFLK